MVSLNFVQKSFKCHFSFLFLLLILFFGVEMFKIQLISIDIIIVIVFLTFRVSFLLSVSILFV